MAAPVGRFAPSTTGSAHLGTLLAALLAWLDARSQGGRILLRLEDLDPQRCRPELAEQMVAQLRWFGLDFDATLRQSEQGAAHAAALDALAAQGCLYACACSRSALRAAGAGLAPDHTPIYPNTCRARLCSPASWRACAEPLRARLPDGPVVVDDEGGQVLDATPAACPGDPVVRRRDGSVAYQLAAVVDDAAQGVTRVVRGQDIAPSTATQVALQQRLGLPRPRYRHHFLLLSARGDKLAKLHGDAGVPELRQHMAPEAVCGVLAHIAGLQATPARRRPGDLLADFSWQRLRRRPLTVSYRPGEELRYQRARD